MFKRCVLNALVIGVSLASAAAAANGDPFDAKVQEVGAANLGAPLGGVKTTAHGGKVHVYSHGAIYWSKATGMHALYGAAYEKYRALDAERGKLGYPITDELTRAEGGTQTLFLHGYILVDKSGAVTAETMPNATFSASGVELHGGLQATMTSPTEALVERAPQAPSGGSTVTCACSKSGGTQRLDLGGCNITLAGRTSIRCQKGGCGSACQIKIVKQVQ